MSGPVHRHSSVSPATDGDSAAPHIASAVPGPRGSPETEIGAPTDSDPLGVLMFAPPPIERDQKRLGAGYQKFKEFFRYTVRELQHRKVNFVLGFLAVFVVVVAVAVAVSTLEKTPVVFLRLGEVDVSETDIELRAGTWTQNPTINHTRMNELLANQDSAGKYSYNSPRFLLNIRAYSAKSCNLAGVDPQDSYWKHAENPACGKYWWSSTKSCFKQRCTDSGFESKTFVVDSALEKRMALGRSWSLPAVPRGQCYMHSSLAKALGVVKGDTVFLQMHAYRDMRPVCESAWPRANMTLSFMRAYCNLIYVPVTVNTTFSDPLGKFGVEDTDAVVLEYSTALDLISRHIYNRSMAEFRSGFAGVDLYSYAQRVLVNMPPPRVDSYIDSNFDAVQRRVTKLASDLLFLAGFNQIEPSVPLLYAMRSTRTLSLFLGLILNVIIAVLVALAVVLIFSLLMISVETKTFDMGVLRMVGMTRVGLIQLLIMQAFSFSVPAWAIGLVVAQGAGFGIAFLFEDVAAVPVTPWLSWNGIILATLWGTAIPLISSVIPIRTALGVSLRDALDVRRSKTAAVKITIERAEYSHLDWAVVVVGFILTVFGFAIYYIFPLALLSFNLDLLMNVFFGIILGMLAGLTMLSLNLQRSLERIVLALFLFWERPAITTIVRKNLIAHRARNTKTTLMFGLALGFIIFIAVAFNGQIESSNYDRQQSAGSYLAVTASGSYKIGKVDQFEEFCKNNSNIEAWGWISQPMYRATKEIDNYQIQTLGRLFGDTNRVTAVSPDLFSVAIPGFLFEGDVDKASPYNIEEQTYSAMGAGGLVLGTTYIDDLLLQRRSHLLLQASKATEQLPILNITRTHAIGFLDTAPALRFSKYPSSRGQDAMVSFPMFVQLSHGNIKSVDGVPLRRLILKIPPTLPRKTLDEIKLGLRKIITGQIGLRIFDYDERVRPLVQAASIVNTLFEFTTAVVMTVCFFSVASSMYSNIHEQSKEIGILRAVGTPRLWMLRIYIWESFVLILSSSILGIMIGTIVGWTMTLQIQLFSQLPILFAFPGTLLVVVLVMSIVLAIAASYGPAWGLMKLPIVAIMRKLG